MPSRRPCGRAVKLRQAAQCGEHERERHLGDGGGLRARHVADGDAVLARRLEVDGVHADADLLHELEARRPGEHPAATGFRTWRIAVASGSSASNAASAASETTATDSPSHSRPRAGRQLRPRFAANDDQGFLHHRNGRVGVCVSLSIRCRSAISSACSGAVPPWRLRRLFRFCAALGSSARRMRCG